MTLLETLTTAAALVIVLGLMVQLARYVRHRSAETITRDLLAKLEQTTARFKDFSKTMAAVPPLIKPAAPSFDEPELQTAAMANNKAFVKVCRAASSARALEGLPLTLYDRTTLRDGWGTPVVFMASGALNIGIQPQSRYFFMSAGPDRRFSTLFDNLYSYERSMAGGGGQNE